MENMGRSISGKTGPSSKLFNMTLPRLRMRQRFNFKNQYIGLKIKK
jgi:hypothetical protein